MQLGWLLRSLITQACPEVASGQQGTLRIWKHPGVELRGYVFPRVGDALAVTHIPPYTSGVLTPIPLRVYLGHG